MTTARKVFDVLPSPQRLEAAWLAVLMTIGMLLEMLSVGLVVPAMAALSGGRSSNESLTLARLRGWFGVSDDTQLVLAGLWVLLGVYAVKAVFLGFLAWRQARFVADVQAGLSTQLFSSYLHQPWTFHLQRNSATLIHAISTEVGHFGTLVSSLLFFITELLVVLGVSCLLLVYEPAAALAAAAMFGAATLAFQYASRNRIQSWGQRNRRHAQVRARHLQQGLHGVKDVKILGRQADFIEHFQRDQAVVATMASRLQAVQQLPRLWYELLAVVGLALIATLLVSQGYTGPRLLSRLGLFAAAAFRVMPAANRMLLTWQSLRYYEPSIDAVYTELAHEAVEPSPAGPVIEFSQAIVLSGVSYRYPGAATNALNGVTLRLAKGRSLGIIGGSGAGKSTLVDVLLGLLIPDAGTVTVDGNDTRHNLRSWQDQIGYVPQSIYLTDDTVAANVAFGVPAQEIDMTAVRRALDAAQLLEFVSGLPMGLDTCVGDRGVRLSGGQRQRIGIARALYHDPPILVLDEATSALDTETERGVMAAVNELHGAKTLVIVAHRLSTVADCDELIRLEGGRIVREGSFAQVTGELGMGS
jgi:ABC-type multidrug transport system fused ATPase/permease subunit